MKIHENHPLKNLNTFGINAYAKYLIEIVDEKELVEFLSDYKFKKEKLLIVGEGSNILFTKDYEGVVLKYFPDQINVVQENENEILLEISAGKNWDELIKYCVDNEFYGIENLSMIPGTVGAAPIQNIGAYGVELKDVFVYLKGYSLDNNEKKNYTRVECNFGYRDSIFKNEMKGKFIITKVALRLQKHKKFNLSYKALKEKFNQPEEEITIKQVSDAVRKIRTEKLPDPVKFGNAGSFFKNPEISEGHFQSLIKEFPDIVYFKQESNFYKIPAGWLIEKTGYKGKRIGNVGTYENQALVIVNYGNASGKEIFDYSQLILNGVEQKFNIKLETEVNII